MQVGSFIGVYQVLGELGHGGMGVVYRAKDTKLDREVAVKVLDFGLAKLTERTPDTAIPRRDSGSDPSSPTITGDPTQPGMILGTAAYMSPEQARGKPVDKRTDIWSFGCVLYECLTGRSLYKGEWATDSIGAVLHKEPDWSRLPQDTPPTVQLLLRKCLTKDPDHRLHDIADARVDLEQARLLAETAAVPHPRGWPRQRYLAASLSVGFLFGAIAVGYLAGHFRSEPKPREWPLRVLEIPVDDLDRGFLGSANFPCISPDGNRVVFSARGRLSIRDLRHLDLRELPGTEGAFKPFWSPDSRQIGFFKRDQLWRIPSVGGQPVQITRIGTVSMVFTAAAGGVWTDDDEALRSCFTARALRGCGFARLRAARKPC